MATAADGGYSIEERRALLDLARNSIHYGLKEHAPLPVDPEQFSAPVRARRASFVTLHLRGDLRGCIGGFEAVKPLVCDVSEHAFASAFRDPRFSPVTELEFEHLEIEISVLHPFEELHPSSEEELLTMLRPGVDGLLLEEGSKRGTFLPAVWRQLQAPAEFLRHLKKKAWLAEDYWSDTLRVHRYTVDEITEPLADTESAV